MSVRVGESWTARNGHRRWVTMGLGSWLFGLGAWAVLVLPLLAMAWLLMAELWMAAECVLIAVSAAAAVVAMVRHHARLSDVTMVRLRWHLFMIGVR